MSFLPASKHDSVEYRGHLRVALWLMGLAMGPLSPFVTGVRIRAFNTLEALDPDAWHII